MIKVLASEMYTHALGPLVRERVTYRMRHPDPGSWFARLNQHIQHMDDDAAIRTLLGGGYEGILLIGDACKEVVGDIYFQPQKDGTELHVFACETNRDRRGCGVGTKLVKTFFEHAWERQFRTVRVTEKDQVMLHILENAIAGKMPLPDFRVVRAEGSGYARLIA
jgi:hypothetical protein